MHSYEHVISMEICRRFRNIPMRSVPEGKKKCSDFWTWKIERKSLKTHGKVMEFYWTLNVRTQIMLILSLFMNSVKLVSLLHSLYWSIHTKNKSKCGSAFAFIFGVN